VIARWSLCLLLTAICVRAGPCNDQPSAQPRTATEIELLSKAEHLATRPVASAARLLFARVVSGVHVGKTARPDAVELNDRVLAGPGEMLHPLGYLHESAGLDRLALALVDRVADPDVERAGDDRYILIVGVRVGRDLEARGELKRTT
jgi:hypothetical protein